MKRREFLGVLSGATAAWPLAARAQQATIPVIGFLNAGFPGSRTHLVAMFWQGLKDAGYIESQNVAIEYRWADDQVDRLPALAADLVRRRVNVIVTPGSSNAPNGAASVAKAATTTIPIVFSVGADPVKSGLVASINRPGGNVTGIHYLTTVLAEKRLGLLREVAPTSALLAVLVNSNDQGSLSEAKEVQAAANILDQKIEIVQAGDGSEIDTAFATLAQNRANALLLIPDPLFFSRRVQIVALANRLGIPAIFTSREYVEAGGLMSYGTDLAGVYRQVGGYTGCILKGVRPADLPVLQVTKFELVINLKTAKTLGLALSSGLLSIADEVIE